ncbi:hypothetical protein RRG08_016462 [Elysia crispata]|uniref:MRH domain-containing protein n=1 Tax=Elysia crispata TaxID=231223 RepID=A0AAE0Y9N6_9GAST|nr:hypothetical protein RRG08_016462 [Elysia crispata]
MLLRRVKAVLGLAVSKCIVNTSTCCHYSDESRDLESRFDFLKGPSFVHHQISFFRQAMAKGQNHQIARDSQAPQVFFVIFSLLTLFVFTEAAENLCNFAKFKSSTSLEAAEKKLSPLVGKSYKSRNNKYEFTVGICTRVTEETDNDKLKDVAVLQQKLTDDGKPDPNFMHDIGNLKYAHITAGSDWIFLEYTGKEVYDQNCAKELKHTKILITCDEWVKDSEAKMMFIEEDNQKTEPCSYLFEMKHQAVCLDAPSGGLSVGSILLIVFFSVAFVYLVVGFLYSRFVLGAKGMEQIPNYEFWKDFGNLQADGCDFLCRTREHRRPGGFRGIGDDQLDPADEMPVVQDENLLPM